MKYLAIIRGIRDNDPILFEKIKRLPKRSRSIILKPEIDTSKVITYFRKGRIEKFCIADGISGKELDFMDSAKFMMCSPETPRMKA